MLEVDVATYLPDDLLAKIDIATMAHSLEARSPLLDHELMEFAASIPAELKVRGTREEVVLRDALRGWLPDEILDRPKQGFGVPLGDWLRGDLRDWARDVLLDPATLDRGYFASRRGARPARPPRGRRRRRLASDLDAADARAVAARARRRAPSHATWYGEARHRPFPHEPRS